MEERQAAVRMNDAWQTMLRRVDKRRDIDARFYKPTCLLAVIDGIGDGTLAPSDIDPERVFARFRDYLLPLFPERASLGWRPFWHLCRDDAWIFTKEGRVVAPENFGPERKPNSLRELMKRIDQVAVPPAQRGQWKSASAREELRAAVIAMLRRDGEACQRVADRLDRDGTLFAGATREVENEDVRVPAGVGRSSDRQGFQQSTAARRAIERRAMHLATALLEGQGWAVEDVATRRSYDLHCTRDGVTRFVEVKGAAGTGEEIRITAAEVAFASLNRSQMILVVVTGILLQPAGDDVDAIGGIVHVLEGWAPEPGDLDPVSYFCRVSFLP